MALIFPGKTKCPLCHETIGLNDATVSTSHFLRDQNDPFWKYSDAALHKRCFLAWDQREQFIHRFNETTKSFIFADGKRHQMQPDGTILYLVP